jgi:GDP-L-fucose synthase
VRIWLTGANGSLGSEVLKEIQSRFHTSELFYPNSKELDLLNSDAVNQYVKKIKPTHVVHLAAKVFGIAGHLEHPNLSYKVNTKIDSNLFHALEPNPPEWIFYASTVAAYGYPYAELPLKEEQLLDGSPHLSELGYSLAKREAIKLLEQFDARHQTKFTYGCLTNLYGSEDRNMCGKGHVIVSLIEKAKLAAKNKQKFEVWGSGKASRDFLSSEDAAKIICELFDKNTGVINIATGKEIKIEFIAQTLVNALSLDQGYIFTGDMEGLPNRFCSIEKLMKYSQHISKLDAKNRLSTYLIESVKK